MPDKNIKTLKGHPLISYTIAAALQSNIFSEVVVSTDTEYYADIARYYGADVPCLRPSKFSGAYSPDIEWVEYTLENLKQNGINRDCFSILRPTSPFRQAETIRRAWKEFINREEIDSLRAVEKCSQHPAKMWKIKANRMTPVLKGEISGIPWHSNQYQSLPDIYVQNASLEIAWIRVVFEEHSISGTNIMPFYTVDYEGFDINNPFDWEHAKHLIQRGKVKLPEVSQTQSISP